MYGSVNYAIIGSDNSLSPIRRQATIWTNVISSLRSEGTYLNGILFDNLKKMHLKISSAAIFSRPQCVKCAPIYAYTLRFYFAVGPENKNAQGSRVPLQWRHNEGDGVSNHQPNCCLPNRLFRRRSKKTSKIRVTGLCAGNSPATGEFSAQRVSNAENVSIWWRHHV